MLHDVGVIWEKEEVQFSYGIIIGTASQVLQDTVSHYRQPTLIEEWTSMGKGIIISDKESKLFLESNTLLKHVKST